MDLLICEETGLCLKTKPIKRIDSDKFYNPTDVVYNMNELKDNDELDLVFSNKDYRRLILLSTEYNMLVTARNFMVRDVCDKIKNELNLSNDIIDITECINCKEKRQIAYKFLHYIMGILSHDIRKDLIEKLIFSRSRIYELILKDESGSFISKYIEEIKEIMDEDDSNNIVIGRLLTLGNINLSKKYMDSIKKKIEYEIKKNLAYRLDNLLVRYISEDTKDYIKAFRVLYDILGNKHEIIEPDEFEDRKLVIKEDEESLKLYRRIIKQCDTNIHSNLNLGRRSLFVIKRLIDEVNNDTILTMYIEYLLDSLRVKCVAESYETKDIPYPNKTYKLYKTREEDYINEIKNIVKNRNLDIPDIDKYSILTEKEIIFEYHLCNNNFKLLFDLLSTYRNDDEYDEEFIKNKLTNYIYYYAYNIENFRNILYNFKCMNNDELQDIVVRAFLVAMEKLRKDTRFKLINYLVYILNVTNNKTKNLFNTKVDKDEIIRYISLLSKDLPKVSDTIGLIILEEA